MCRRRTRSRSPGVKGAGAVVLGKTNVPLVLADWQSFNDIYGTTNNPWDLARTPGGSSGGSAAALAAGFGPLSLGSDIGGSLRVPANYCGVYGHKPTHGIIPTRGHAPPSVPAVPRDIDLAVVGPMARSASDIALALDILAGPDEARDAIAYRLALPPPRHLALKDFRVLRHRHASAAADGRVSARGAGKIVGAARQGGCHGRARKPAPSRLRRGGAALHAVAAVRLLRVAGRPSNTTRSKPRRPRSRPATTASPPSALRGAVLSHRDWMAADAARAGLRERWRRLFARMGRRDLPDDADAGLSARPLDARLRAPDQHRRQGVSISGPAGLARNRHGPGPAGDGGADRPLADTGLPIGVQIVGPYLEDRTTIAFAELMEQEFGGFAPPPGYAG